MISICVNICLFLITVKLFTFEVLMFLCYTYLYILFFLAIEILKQVGLIYFFYISCIYIFAKLRSAAKQFRWDDFDHFLNNIFCVWIKDCPNRAKKLSYVWPSISNLKIFSRDKSKILRVHTVNAYLTLQVHKKIN